MPLSIYMDSQLDNSYGIHSPVSTNPFGSSVSSKHNEERRDRLCVLMDVRKICFPITVLRSLWKQEVDVASLQTQS